MSPDAGTARTSPNTRGLRVQLPDGWTAEVDSQDALLIGPPGRAVLRIARAPAGKKVPSSKDLATVFTSELPGTRVETLERKDDDRGSLWIGRVEPGRSGAAPWEVAFGARRVEDEVLLCATLPGASDDEVQAAAKLCGSLGDGPG